MLTDPMPRKPALLAVFLESDRLSTLEIPLDDRLRAPAKSLESGMRDGSSTRVRQACSEFLTIVADFYGVPKPGIRVLAARPLRVRQGRSASELFGDYAPDTQLIRVWMRTAIRKQVTS